MVLVSIPVRLVWAQSAAVVPTRTITAEMRIDATAANLAPINFIAVSSSGILAILQPDDNTILFFSPGGKRLGSFGRTGAGPGEFRSMQLPEWIGDTLAVYDAMLHQFTYISPDRRLVRNIAADLSGRRDERPCRIQSATASAINPFCADSMHLVSPDSSFSATIRQNNPVSSQARFSVTIRPRRGRESSREFVVPSVPIPSRYADSMMALMTRGKPPDFAQFIRSRMPAYFAPVYYAKMGNDGSVWIRLWTTPGAPTGRYLVLDRHATHIADLSIPTTIMPQVVTLDRIWALQVDRNDMQSVVRFRVH